MFDIQELRDQLDLERQSIELCALVLEMLQRRFGSEYVKKYKEFSDEELISIAAETLAGLTPTQVMTGLNLARSEEYCPSLPRFRSLCETSTWLSPNAAWVQALNFMKDHSKPITIVAKQALDEVSVLLSNTDDDAIAAKQKHNAGFAFRDVYTALVTVAQKLGQAEILWVPQTTKTKNDTAKKLGYMPKPDMTVLDKLSDENRAAVNEQRRLMAQGIAPREALTMARKSIGERKLNKSQEMIGTKATPMQQLIAQGRSPTEAYRMTKGQVS